jgi:hypothetical protein
MSRLKWIPAEDGVGIGKAARAYVYRIWLPEESRKSRERMTQRCHRSHTMLYLLPGSVGTRLYRSAVRL